MRTVFCLLALFMIAGTVAAADVPAQYQLVYASAFSGANSIDAYAFSDPAAWRLGKAGERFYLELFKGSDYKTVVHSPSNLGLLRSQKFGDFVLEADLMQTGNTDVARHVHHESQCLLVAVELHLPFTSVTQ